MAISVLYGFYAENGFHAESAELSAEAAKCIYYKLNSLRISLRPMRETPPRTLRKKPLRPLRETPPRTLRETPLRPLREKFPRSLRETTL